MATHWTQEFSQAPPPHHLCTYTVPMRRPDLQ
ncbi:hypothetical protein PDIP_31130 [Penicillium digitatum Pd1]|uniref:Uncharacterized protein n=1 Tax=Penicillium digitatum (strain Pd1 / CECT 20795) TaxID=1170230 RepID=K9GSH6_PEND1|nr:hypothetical protein PDIP_31130 [Penicillium digitatum Pd1]EKV17598.1 hypothetical protein PDIP_31130 [Penicillium digitatum Pd1]